MSRLGPVAAVQDVLLRLINAGVAIYDLGERRLLTRQTLDTERGLLADVVQDLEAAHRYSDRLSRRLRDFHGDRRKRIQSNQPVRCSQVPWWITKAPDGSLHLNESVAVIHEIYRLSETGLGGTAIAGKLNDSGFRNSRGGLWTGSSVDRTMARPATYGVLVLKDGTEIADFYPAAITGQQFRAATHRRKSGMRRGFVKGPQQHWIGAGISKCKYCGGAISVNSGTARDEAKSRIYYVRCSRPKCPGAGGWPLKPVTEHLLWCLTGPLQEHIATPPVRTPDLDQVEAEVADAYADLTAAQAKVEAAVFDPDLDLAIIKLLQTAVNTARERHGAALARRDAQAAQSQRQTLPEATEMDTPEGRRAFNIGLRRVGMSFLFDRPNQRIGIDYQGQQVWTELGDFLAANVVGVDGVEKIPVGDAVEPEPMSPDEQAYWDEVWRQAHMDDLKQRYPNSIL